MEGKKDGKENENERANVVFLPKGVPGGPSGPSREGPGVGHKISVGH